MNKIYFIKYILLFGIIIFIITFLISNNYNINSTSSISNVNSNKKVISKKIIKLLNDENGNLYFSNSVNLEDDKCLLVIDRFMNEINNGLNPLKNESLMNLISSMNDDLQRYIMNDVSIKLNNILSPVVKSPAIKSFAQEQNYIENYKIFNKTHALNIRNYKDILKDISRYYVNTPNFSCHQHLDVLINNVLTGNLYYSHYEFIDNIFVELGKKFADNPEYVDCLFSYLKSNHPELVYITLFNLLTYHHLSPELVYFNNRSILLDYKNRFDFKASAFLEGTTELEIVWYNKEIIKKADKLLKLIDGVIPKFDPSKVKSEVHF